MLADYFSAYAEGLYGWLECQLSVRFGDFSTVSLACVTKVWSRRKKGRRASMYSKVAHQASAELLSRSCPPSLSLFSFYPLFYPLCSFIILHFLYSLRDRRLEQKGKGESMHASTHWTREASHRSHRDIALLNSFSPFFFL